MLVNKWTKGFVILFALLFFCTWGLQLDAWARAGGGGSRGGGGSIGSRGSRSSSPPTTYTAPRPTQPSQPGLGTPAQPTPQPGSFWRSFGGGMLGGLAGSFLFRGLFGGMGGGMGGIGLFDILLLCGIGYLIYWYVKKKRLAAQEMAGSYQSSAAGPAYQAQYPPVYDQPRMQPGRGDLDQGLANIRQFDPDFDEAKFQDMAMDTVFQNPGRLGQPGYVHRAHSLNRGDVRHPPGRRG